MATFPPVGYNASLQRMEPLQVGDLLDPQFTYIPITSGSGPIPYVAGEPTIYTDIDNGNQYYRDASGNIMLFNQGSGGGPSGFQTYLDTSSSGELFPIDPPTVDGLHIIALDSRLYLWPLGWYEPVLLKSGISTYTWAVAVGNLNSGVRQTITSYTPSVPGTYLITAKALFPISYLPGNNNAIRPTLCIEQAGYEVAAQTVYMGGQVTTYAMMYMGVSTGDITISMKHLDGVNRDMEVLNVEYVVKLID